MAAALAGCGPPVDLTGSPGALVSAEAWAPQDPADDPLADHRPADPSCAPGGWLVEDDRVEVQTGICHYLSLMQPIRAPVQAGDELGVLLWHQGLDAAEPAEAHVALLLDGVPVWETTASIPAPATLYEQWVTVDTSAPAGAPLVLHLHNHGDNTWAVAPVEHRW